jgi:hypothetical protein
MSMPLRFEFEWLDAPGVAEPVLARTWARLEIRTEEGDENCVTRVVDRIARSSRNSVYGSVFPLARWMVGNWWFLLFEPCPISEFHGGRRLFAGSRYERDWLARHNLLVAREGNALPDFTLFSDGSWITGLWLPDPARNHTVHVVRFVGDGTASLERDATEAAMREFVEGVVERVGDLAPESEDVEEFLEDWSLLKETSTGDRVVCQRAATMGVDPYDPDSLDVLEFLQSSMSEFPTVLARDLLEATDRTRLQSDVAWVEGAVRELGVAAESVHPESGTRAFSAAFQAGYDTARLFRANCNVPNGPIEDLGRTVSARCKWPVEHRDIRETASESAILAAVGRTDAHLPRVLLGRGGDQMTARFRLARAVYFVETDSAIPRLVTKAYTWDQRASRAFAAELLVPAAALRERADRVLDEDRVHSIAVEFGVSSAVVRHQLANHGIARIDYD